MKPYKRWNAEILMNDYKKGRFKITKPLFYKNHWRVGLKHPAKAGNILAKTKNGTKYVKWLI